MLDKELIKEINDRLFVYELMSLDEAQYFYAILFKYLKNRMSKETFLNKLDETIKFYEYLDIYGIDIINSISKWPAIIHSDKKDLFNKYLILGSMVDAKTHKSNRRDILINNPKDYMTGIDTIYSRVMFLLSTDAEGITRNNNITRRKVLKCTHKEFELIYHISEEQLKKLYKYDDTKLEIIKNWKINQELFKNQLAVKGVK